MWQVEDGASPYRDPRRRIIEYNHNELFAKRKENPLCAVLKYPCPFVALDNTPLGRPFMMINTTFFLLLITALVDWYAVFRDHYRLRYVTKPLVLILLIVWFTRSGGWEGSGVFFGVALIFSLFGDIFLLKGLLKVQPGFFQWGLVSFLIAQIAYVIGFNQPRPLLSFPSLGIVIAVALVSFFNGGRLIGSLNAKPANQKLVLPVTIYMIVISLMLASALNTLLRDDWLGSAALLSAFGATLFYISDSILAHDKFSQPIRTAEMLVTITYHLAQIGIIAAYLAHSVPLWIPY
ncbi:MAG: hypothetical protein DDG59_04635 [Anaerolineae bacterium]|nr:MAG: hypothetical protein DDG59_04635 [Anaerolineae bacterium]